MPTLRLTRASHRLGWSVFYPFMQHSIKIASARSGLSPHVIRIWERRYGALTPTRSGTNRRLYCDEEIERLKLLKELTDRGHRIGKLAGLGTAELKRLADDERAEGILLGESDAMLECQADIARAAVLAVQKYDAERLRALLHLARRRLGHRATLLHVITPLIDEVGCQWQVGQVRKGQEHLATAAIREFLFSPIPGNRSSEGAPELVVSTPGGEMHELGAMLAAASARGLGWRVTYLGPSLPPEEIAACAAARSARAVAVSVVYPEHALDIAEQLRELRRLLPANVALIVGGRAAPSYAAEMGDLQIAWVDGLNALDDVLVRLSRTRLPRTQEAG